MNIRKLKMHQTAAKTWRVLVNGAVHPLLVGFQSTDDAIARATAVFAGEELLIEEQDQDPLVYLPMYAMGPTGVTVIETLRRFLPSELEMAEISELIERLDLAPRQEAPNLSSGQEHGGTGKPIPGRYWITYNGTKFAFNDYDLESLPVNVREYICPALSNEGGQENPPQTPW